MAEFRLQVEDRTGFTDGFEYEVCEKTRSHEYSKEFGFLTGRMALPFPDMEKLEGTASQAGTRDYQGFRSCLRYFSGIQVERMQLNL